MKALDGLDPALEHRARLAIAVLLARHGEISFAAFKQQLDLTDGNLGAQLRRLEDDGYLALRRDFVERKPVTWYRLTAPGRKALDRHLGALRDVIAVASS
jgi:DNA-binding transcriptional ArsR family regulator